MLQDCVQAWRSLRATPRLTLTAVACAALGLAAAIFMTALVRAVLFATPEIPDAHRLVRVWTTSTMTSETADVSFVEATDLRERARSFDAVESASRTRLAHTTEAGTERIRGESVTPGYFTLIGVRPVLGRLFDPAEYEPGGPRAVVISQSLWQRRYGGRTDIIGQPFKTRLTGRESADAVQTIVGVMPPGFRGTVDPDESEFWQPVAHYEPAAHMASRTVRATWVLARLRPDPSFAAAREEVQAIATALAAEHPDAYDNVTLRAEPFGESWRERFRLSLYTLLAAAALLLLIACTNVAMLLLARLAGRETELRVRAALGAPRGRLLRQLLVESGLIAGAAGAAGLAIAAIAIPTFASAGVFALPPYVQIAIDARSAIAGVALVVLTGLLFGVLPAVLGSGTSLTSDGRGGHRVSLGRRERRHGRLLVTAQVALTFLLLVGSTLLFRTYVNLVAGDPGYRTQHLLRMAVSPDPNVFRDRPARLALAGEITRTFDAYPGVQRTAVMAGVLPPWYDETVDLLLGADARLRDVGRHSVDDGFFDVMGMSFRSGRRFDPADRTDGAETAIVSESLARRIEEATGRDPIGQTLAQAPMSGMRAESFQIIGVVNDVLYHGPLRPRPAAHDIYVPLERGGPVALSIAIQTTVDPATLSEPLSRQLGKLAPSSPQHWISTMEAELGLQFRDARLYAWLSGVYGVAAALLSVLGIYGVLANGVARRHRELGVRMAIGASAGDILRLVLGEGARTLTAGVVIGACLAFAAARLLQGLLYGVAPTDALTFAVVGIALLGVGLLAALAPSVRAAKLSPTEALRD